MMHSKSAIFAEDCRKQAMSTSDVDRQSLLHFMADAWRVMAETGEPTSMIPDYLRHPDGEREALH
jgi:hypothetical protein